MNVVVGMPRNWSRYARALDMRLSGAKFNDIAAEFGVSRQRAQQMVTLAKRQLAFRVFKGVARPLPPPPPPPRPLGISVLGVSSSKK